MSEAKQTVSSTEAAAGASEQQPSRGGFEIAREKGSWERRPSALELKLCTKPLSYDYDLQSFFDASSQISADARRVSEWFEHVFSTAPLKATAESMRFVVLLRTVALSTLSGLTWGEAVRLKWKDIDWTEGLAVAHRVHGDVVVPLTASARELLQAYRHSALTGFLPGRVEDEYVVPWKYAPKDLYRSPTRAHPYSPARVLEDWAERLTGKRVREADTLKAYILALLSAGIGVKWVCDAMRWNLRTVVSLVYASQPARLPKSALVVNELDRRARPVLTSLLCRVWGAVRFELGSKIVS